MPEKLEELVREVVAEQNAWLREEWEAARKERDELRELMREAPAGVRLLEIEEARAALARADDVLRNIREAIIRDAARLAPLGALGATFLS